MRNFLPTCSLICTPDPFTLVISELEQHCKSFQHPQPSGRYICATEGSEQGCATKPAACLQCLGQPVLFQQESPFSTIFTRFPPHSYRHQPTASAATFLHQVCISAFPLLHIMGKPMKDYHLWSCNVSQGWVSAITGGFCTIILGCKLFKEGSIATTSRQNMLP